MIVYYPDRIKKRYGISVYQYKKLLKKYGDFKLPSHPFFKYRYQKSGAKRRGIEWGFTFKTWWNIWNRSGKWEMRGTGKNNYVMARKRDIGPYKPGNVYICTSSQNSKDYFYYSEGYDERNRINFERRSVRNEKTIPIIESAKDSPSSTA